MAEQTIRVNVPDGYEVVRVGVPNNGDLILSDGEVIVSPPTVYDRVIVRKAVELDEVLQPHSDQSEVANDAINRERKAFENHYALEAKYKSRFSYHPTVQSSLQGKYKYTDIERAWSGWLNRAILDIDKTSRAATLRDKVMQTWEPPLKAGGESTAVVAQTATMQTIAYIMGPEFMGKLDRNQQQAIDSGMLFFRAAFEDAKA